MNNKYHQDVNNTNDLEQPLLDGGAEYNDDDGNGDSRVAAGVEVEGQQHDLPSLHTTENVAAAAAAAAAVVEAATTNADNVDPLSTGNDDKSWWCFHTMWNIPLLPDDWNTILEWVGYEKNEVRGDEDLEGLNLDQSRTLQDRRHVQRDRQPDQLLSYRFVAMKFMKFVVLTWFGIIVVHFVVVKGDMNDRDKYLTVGDIWLYEGDQIIRDCVVFYTVGRIYLQPCGVDNLLWTVMICIANVYFQSQHFVSWLQHSVTLYEMHCVWPWQLWVFAIALIPLFTTILVAHVVVAFRHKILTRKLFELVTCLGMFVVPVMTSPYFHFHHWFAGWVFGMHANLPDVWWSRATMAYFWGMYINGIAVYGRDPLLTCDYVKFMVVDQRCHFGEDEVYRNEDEGSSTLQSFFVDKDDHQDRMPVIKMIMTSIVPIVGMMRDDSHPADWSNCSSQGYHP